MPKDIQHKNAIEKDSKYLSLLEELNSIIQQGHNTAYKTVDNIKVQTYWQIGERIVREELNYKDRADYGQNLIKQLALDLDMRFQQLYEIVNFYKCYPIFRSVNGKLSWTHYVFLIKLSTEKERQFYQAKVILHSWSVRELKRQIVDQLYSTISQDEIKKLSSTTLPAVNPSKIFKNTLNFNFIESSKHSELELEDSISLHFEQFLKEMGEDFAILGRQVPIKIDGNTHLIDLVLYHRGIPCMILVDLKIGKFDSRDIGQMNKYVGYYRHSQQYDHEKDTIGLIICKEAGKEEVKYALDGLEERIFISEYKAKLPTEQQIKNIVNKIR